MLNNEWQGVGVVKQEPEIKMTKGGPHRSDKPKPYAVFYLVVSRHKYRISDSLEEKTTWVRIKVWDGTLVEAVKAHVKRGDELIVRGELDIRSYEEDGEKKSITEIVLSEFELCDRSAHKRARGEILGYHNQQWVDDYEEAMQERKFMDDECGSRGV